MDIIINYRIIYSEDVVGAYLSILDADAGSEVVNKFPFG